MREILDSGRCRAKGRIAAVVRVRRVSGELLAIASLNTRGIPLTAARLRLGPHRTTRPSVPDAWHNRYCSQLSLGGEVGPFGYMVGHA